MSTYASILARILFILLKIIEDPKNIHVCGLYLFVFTMLKIETEKFLFVTLCIGHVESHSPLSYVVLPNIGIFLYNIEQSLSITTDLM